MSLPIPNFMALPKALLVTIMGGVIFLGLIIFIVVLLMMGSEGRYHLRRGFNKKGVDLINYNRTSNALIAETIRFNGKYWSNRKGGIYETIDTIKNPDSKQSTFNDAISRTPHWQGNRRPVLFAVEELFFTFTPDFMYLMQKATLNEFDSEKLFDLEKLGSNPHALNSTEKSNPESENTDTPESKKINGPFILNWLKERFEHNVRAIHFVNPIDMSLITDHIDGATAYVLRKSHDEGEDSGILKMTKPKTGIALGTKGKIAIGAGAILMIIILVVLLQRGGIKLPGSG